MYGWLVAVIASTISNNDAFIVTFRNSMLDTRRYLSVHEVSARYFESRNIMFN